MGTTLSPRKHCCHPQLQNDDTSARMSPTSVDCAVSNSDKDDQDGEKSLSEGVRKLDGQVRLLPLKINKDSHRIRKAPLPVPTVQLRPPVIIHTYAPKVIHTEPDNFMSLVQKLTGSSDTRSRLKHARKLPVVADKDDGGGGEGSIQRVAARDSVSSQLDTTEQQASNMSTVCSTGCSSPSSSSELSGFPTTECGRAEPMVQQSGSPRGPLPPFEAENFLNSSMFAAGFDPPTGNNTATYVTSFPIKREGAPTSINDSPAYNFTMGPSYVDAKNPRASYLSKPKIQQTPPSIPLQTFFDINSPLPSPSLLSPGFLADLPVLSPGTGWSQALMDSLFSPSTLGHQPIHGHFGGYNPSAGTMVALRDIQAFMFS